MVRFSYIFIFLLLSCSPSEKSKNNKFSLDLYSDNGKYVLKFENSFKLEDRKRVEKFTIYKLNEDKRRELNEAAEIADSLFNYHGKLLPDSLSVSVNFDKDAILIRNFQVSYEKSDPYFNNQFTEQSFSWNFEDSTLTYLSMGLKIKLE